MKAEAQGRKVNTSTVSAVSLSFNDVLLLPPKRNGRLDRMIGQHHITTEVIFITIDHIGLSVDIQPLQVKDCCVDFNHAHLTALILTACGLSNFVVNLPADHCT